MPAAIYARVSTDDQALHGFSLTDQVHSCRERLTAMGITELREYIDDGYSGEFLERPALARLRLALTRREISHVMIYDPDRLSRNLVNQLILADEIEQAGAKLLFITGDYNSSPEGKLFFSLRGAVAAFEKAKIRERSLRGKRAKVMSGKPILPPCPPYGYTCDRRAGTYQIEPQEAATVQEIFKRYTQEKCGISTLASMLAADGYVNRKGRPFSPSVLYRLLSNEMYAGIKWSFQTYQKTIAQKKRQCLRREKAEWLSIPVPAIVDRPTYQLAQETKQQNKVLARRNHVNLYLLSSFIRCLDCGYKLTGVTIAKKSTKEYHYYACSANKNDHHCANRIWIPAGELDQAVWQKLGEMVTAPTSLRQQQTMKSADDHHLAAVAALQKQELLILKWVNSGTLSPAAAEQALKRIQQQLRTLHQEKLLAGQYDDDREVIDAVKQQFFKQNFATKRRILQSLQIEIFAKKKEGVTSFSIHFAPPS